jgi:hypothetical protein
VRGYQLRHLSIEKNYLFAGAPEAGAGSFAAGASVFAAGTALVSALAFAAVFEFESTGASAGVSGEVVCRTEIFPCNAGIEIKSASTIKPLAAPIVIFESTDAVPRGPNAEFEILLVNRAPASVLPGCSSTVPISTRHEMKNKA